MMFDMRESNESMTAIFDKEENVNLSLPDLICTDSDGVLKDSKQPVAGDLVELITRARMRHGTTVVRITGAPAHHLDDGLIVDRMFGESGGVERFADGRVEVASHAGAAADALERLRRATGIDTQDGFIDTRHGSFGVEGVRHTTLTLFFGHHPLYPKEQTSADTDAVAAWIQEHIEHHELPLYLMKGKGNTFDFIDIGHPEIMRKERVVKQIVMSGSWRRRYYLGDSGNDAGAMELEGFIPVTFSNATKQVKEIVRRRNGIMIEKPGPHGGSKEFFLRLIEGRL